MTGGPCPNCGTPTPYQNPRYPHALCHDCCTRATDLAGRHVRMGNESLSGGFVAWHDDGTPCEQVTREGRVLIDGRLFSAREAHMGGVVVEPLRSQPGS